MKTGTFCTGLRSQSQRIAAFSILNRNIAGGCQKPVQGGSLGLDLMLAKAVDCREFSELVIGETVGWEATV
jgi:hypothetical protein